MWAKSALAALLLAVATLSNAVNVYQLDENFLKLFGTESSGSSEVAPTHVRGGGNPPYSAQRLEAFRKNLIINLKFSGTDAIIAARSKENPNYFYDWAR
mgnify:CR=1 FL=1